MFMADVQPSYMYPKLTYIYEEFSYQQPHFDLGIKVQACACKTAASSTAKVLVSTAPVPRTEVADHHKHSLLHVA